MPVERTIPNARKHRLRAYAARLSRPQHDPLPPFSELVKYFPLFTPGATAYSPQELTPLPTVYTPSSTSWNLPISPASSVGSHGRTLPPLATVLGDVPGFGRNRGDVSPAGNHTLPGSGSPRVDLVDIPSVSGVEGEAPGGAIQCKWQGCEGFSSHPFDQNGWKVHMNTHREGEGDEMVCRWEGSCGARVHTSGLMNHVRSHHRRFRIGCRMCRFSYTSGDSFNDHLVSKHSRPMYKGGSGGQDANNLGGTEKK